MKISKAFPGMSSPAAGFDEPFEMLASCHDRIRRSLALLGRLCAHVREHGADGQAATAADDVLRYFSIAAPQHHQDEERHVVPMLRRLGDAQSIATADRIVTDHARFHAAWAVLEPQLRALELAHRSASTSEVGPASDAGAFGAIGALEASAHAFIEMHTAHLALEEAVAFPAAARVVTRQGDAALRAMGAEMATRRGTPNTGSTESIQAPSPDPGS
ncbi:MAG: hemerythrin domain-containing protein [Burkholderiaceae bacterium]